MKGASGSIGDSGRVRWWAALLALIGGTSDLPRLGVSTVVAQPEIYRSAGQVPGAWREFALQLQSKFVQRLASDQDAVRSLAKEMSAGAEAAGAEARAVTLRAWVLPDGKVARLEFDGLEPAMTAALRTLLIKVDAGSPPADMLQPVHLRLSLRPQPVQEQAH
jgi:hypothetical protein